MPTDAASACSSPSRPPRLVIPLLAPWYLDLDKRLIGPLLVRGNQAVVARLFSLPPLSATAAALVGEALAEPLAGTAWRSGNASASMRSLEADLVPVLAWRR
jgi:hypothetical protein